MKTVSKITWYLVAAMVALILSFVIASLKYPLGLMIGIAAAFIILVVPIIFYKVEIGVFLIAFFLPFERVPTIELGSATLKINHLLIVLTLVACLFAVLTRQVKIFKDPIRSAVTFFLLTLLLSIPVAVNISRALQVYAFMILMGLVYFVVTVVIRNKESLRLAISGILWGALVAGFFGILQFGGDMIGLPNEITLLKKGYDSSTFGFARVQAFSQEPLYFANYIFVPFLLIFFLNLKNSISGIFNKNLSYVLLVVLLIDFVLTVSRGAYLAAAVVFVVVLVTQAKTIINFKTVAIALSIIFFTATGAYFALSRSESRAIDEFVSHVAVEDREEGESVVMRLSAASQAYEIFIDKPLLGVGLGNFGPVIQGDPDEPPEEDGWAIVNNEYLELLAEGGIVALIGFVILITTVYFRGLRAYFASKDKFMSSVVFALLTALLGVLVQYATFSTLYIIHVWFLIGLIGASSNIILRGSENEK